MINVTRRRFLGSASAAAVVVASPGATGLPAIAAAHAQNIPFQPYEFEPDEALIMVAAFAMRLNADYEALALADEDDPSLDDLGGILNEAIDFITRSSAVTLDGLAAKAEIVKLQLPHRHGRLSSMASREEAIAWSLACDAIALAGKVPGDPPMPSAVR